MHFLEDETREHVESLVAEGPGGRQALVRMHPQELDESHVRSGAEIDVFRAIERDLSDERLVFHDVTFLRRDHATGVTPGGIDFDILHLDQAVTCLEVKSGGIECRNGEFPRISKGTREYTPRPFTTSLDHRFEFGRQVVRAAGNEAVLSDPPSLRTQAPPSPPSPRRARLSPARPPQQSAAQPC